VSGLTTSNGGTTANAGQLNGGVNVVSGSVTNSNIVTGGATLTGGTFNMTAGSVTGTTTNNGGIVANNGGAFGAVNNNTGTFNNNTGTAGAVSNAASGSNSGTIASLSNTNGTFGNSGTVTGASTVSFGVVTNTGSFGSTLGIGGGTFNMTAGSVTGTATNLGGTVTNNGGAFGTVANIIGTFDNNTGTAGAVSNSATATNAGTIASLSNTAGTFGNTGTVTGASTVSGGIVTNSGAGSFQSTLGVTGGTFNLTGGSVTGATTNNGGTVTNNGGTFGAVTNTTGTFNNNTGNAGAVSNAATGTNGGTIASLSNSGGTFGNSGTISGGATVTGGTLNTNTATSIVNGGLTNTSVVNARNQVNGAIANNTAGIFNVTGALVGNNTFTNNGTAVLNVTGGNYTGITTLTNNSTNASGIVVAATRTLTAANIVNSAGATFTNNGVTNGLLNSNGGTVTNSATGVWNGDVTSNTSSATGITNSGNWNGNLLANTGSGTVVNNLNWNGTVNNTWLFTNNATGTVTGLFIENCCGNLTTTGTLAGGLVNLGLVFAQGTINNGIANNAGAGINVTGALVTNSFVNNAATATIIINNQSFTGITTYTNAGNTLLGGGGAGTIGATAFNNSGTLTVFSTNNTINGSLNNTGTINLLGATLGGTPALTVTGNLVMSAAATYLVQVNPTTAAFTTVTGAATLGGATVSANYAAGSYVAKRYTIVTAAGGVNGTFGALVTTGQPASLTSTLSYDANNAYLNLNLNFALPGGALNQNQQNVANALTGFFNRTGGIPSAFASLTSGQLTQSDGEAATGSQQSTFNAMNQFMGVMTDPFIAGRGDPVSAGGGATGYADEQSMAYAAKRNPNDALAAIYRKAPVAEASAQRWSVWAAGFGGSQTTSGNAVLGSNNTSSNLYGTAVGADYRISPNALAGGGTNFSVANNLGGGRSDLFQAGAFIRHNMGAAYLSGALAYGWQDITTNRTLTIAGIDQLQAKFNANAWSGRLEGGYRVVSQGIGWTPYAAGQFTTFDLPAYAERAIVGANIFALAYAAKSVTATRSELGLRTDKSFAMEDGVFTLRGRAAWAHDYNSDRSIGATFQTLPGASFVVNGARQATDAVLLTASAEKKWLNGWSAAGTFEGEFSNVTTSYAGKGVVRYAW
jgi:uncharacterized protein with beta-barrel porin domain